MREGTDRPPGNGGSRTAKAFLRLLPPVAAAALAARFLWVVAKLARALPEGPWPVARFALVAAVVCLAPGLALLRAARIRLRPAEIPVFVLATSLAASGLGAWALYFCGLYTRGAAFALLALLALAGAWGAGGALSRASLRSAVARLRAAPPSAWLSPLLAALLLEGVFELSAGTPFSEWDALVTWDRWAADMGARTGLGGYLMGCYPQLLPAIHSLFYKVAATPADAVFPAEHLLLHGFDAVFPALLALSLIALGRRFRFSGLLALALLAGNARFFADLAAGQADVPLAAFAAAVAALLPPLLEDGRAARRALAPPAALFFALVFAKGTGVILGAALVAAAFARDRRGALRVALPALLAAVALGAPYLAHQLWLGAHPDARETASALVSLPVHAAHTRLFSADAAHLAGLLRDFFAGFGTDRPGGSAVVLFPIAALAALLRRRTRAAALACLALLAFWFFTASYDGRNAYPAFVLAAAVFTAAADPGPGLAAGARPIEPLAVFVRLWLTLLLLAFSVGAMSASGALSATLAPVLSRYRPPRAAMLAPADRHMAMRPQGDLRNIFFAAPWAARAERIWAGDALFRVLAPKGRYSIQINAWCDEPAPGDLFVQSPWTGRPPEGFVPIAELRRASGYRTLWMYRPDLAPGLVLEIPAPGGDAPPARELFGEAAAGDPFAAYLAPVRDGAALRLPNPRPLHP